MHALFRTLFRLLLLVVGAVLGLVALAVGLLLTAGVVTWALLRGRHLMLNLIPFNSVEGSGYERPPWDHAAEMTRRLNRGGVLTRLRRSAAQDVDGGCGQLRARNSTAAGKPVPVAVVAATTAAAAVAG